MAFRFSYHHIAACLMASLMLSSCDELSVFDGPGDCPSRYDIDFISNYNLANKDDFFETVKSLSLFVFDAQGNFVKEYAEADSVLQRVGPKGYHRMSIEDLPAGDYSLLTWCNVDTVAHPSFRLDPKHPLTLTEAKCRLDSLRQNQNDNMLVSDKKLTQLLHGHLFEQHLPDRKDTVLDMHLVRDVKNVEIILQRLDGQPLNPDNFVYALEGDNSVLGYDNDLLTADDICYQPYLPLESGNEGKAVVGNLSTSRLMPDHPLRLRVYDKWTHKPVLDIPFVDYALLTKEFEHADMDDQEYLDRRDDYSIIFFLDNNNQWFAGQLVVNGWKIVDINQSL